MWRYEVSFYEKKDGTQPVKEFLDETDLKMAAKIIQSIDLLKEYGPALREPYSKPIGNGIFELRSKAGSDISRVLYFFVVGRKIILTNGFIKKTQKTPLAQIKLAKKYREDYLKRMGEK